MTLRVFVVDDHEMVRNGLRAAIDAQEDMELVGEAGTMKQALGSIGRSQPDIAILDIRLPDGDGVELCREIRSRHPEVSCVMLTSYSGDAAVHGAILAGADGFILKGVAVDSLIHALRTVGAGGSLLDPAVTAGVLERLRGSDPEPAGLTPKEDVVLAAIVEGLSNRRIAERMGVAEQTIKNHVSSILAKLGVSTRTQAALRAAKLDPEPPGT